MDRRSFCVSVGSVMVVGAAHAQSAPAGIQPIWLGFGLNVPANIASQRFRLSSSLLSTTLPARKVTFQIEINNAIVEQLKKLGDFVVFKNAAEFGENTFLGAALDYENVLSARLGDSTFMVMHLVGHGVLLDFDRTRGWSMRSSFPFPVTLLRETGGGDTEALAKKYLVDAYLDSQGSFTTSFAKTAKRLSSTWRDTGVGAGFNVRVMGSAIHPDAVSKLKGWGIEKNITPVWLGHLASAAVCEALDIPVVPFSETQALGNYTYKFSERLVAQNVRMPDENDIDIRLHLSIRNVSREIKYRSQLQRWEATRMVVIDIKIRDDRNDEILSLRMGYQDEQPDALAREEENPPARDAHFFDMVIYRGLLLLFTGIDKSDLATLGKVFVKPDAQQLQAITSFRDKYRKAFGKGT